MAKVTVQIPATLTSNYISCDVATGTQLTIGESVTIHITLKKYYGTSTLPYFRWLSYGQEYGEHINFTKVDDKHYILTTSFSDYGEGSNRTVQLQMPDITQDFTYIDCESLVQCTSSLPTGEYAPGQGLTITVTAGTNYEFPTTPYIWWKVGSAEHTQELTKVEDYQYSATFAFEIGKTYYIIGEAVQKTIVSDKYGLITAYRVSKEELKTIASKRWIERSWEPKTWQGAEVLFIANDEYIDTAKYVVSVFKIFMNLSAGQREKLYFGPYDMDMMCEVIPADVVTLDFGTVSIVGRYQNNIDYEHTTLEAYLPFIGMVTLNTADFMDRTVRLQYQVNTLTGDAVAMLSADGKIMFTGTCNIAFQIPYQLGGNEYVSTQMTAPSNFLEDTAPFIHVKEGVALNPNNTLPYKDTKYYARFGDLSGYTEADEVDFEVLSTHITKTEIDEIIQLLHNGVFL